MTEKTTCPDCNKTVSIHNLKYTQKKFCKSKKEEDTPFQGDQVQLGESNEEDIKKTKEDHRRSLREKRLEKARKLAASALP
jgi:hypothetical protein